MMLEVRSLKDKWAGLKANVKSKFTKSKKSRPIPKGNGSEHILGAQTPTLTRVSSFTGNVTAPVAPKGLKASSASHHPPTVNRPPQRGSTGDAALTNTVSSGGVPSEDDQKPLSQDKLDRHPHRHSRSHPSYGHSRHGSNGSNGSRRNRNSINSVLNPVTPWSDIPGGAKPVTSSGGGGDRTNRWMTMHPLRLPDDGRPGQSSSVTTANEMAMVGLPSTGATGGMGGPPGTALWMR
ncbi:hypothetical protein J3R30DRAFT_2288409 [Lentinula aciculospora]|nr:hypothetical protein J3R30DRAFT_2288409 [Lentinula aciculospora]